MSDAKPLKALSDAQQVLLRKIGSKWADVPTATRATTVLSLVRRGLIEHRYKEPRHYADWVTWGEVRLKPAPKTPKVS